MAASAANKIVLPNSSSSEEEVVIVLDDSDIRGGIERCSKSLIGRLLADCPFSVGTIESALQSIWRLPDGFKVIDHGGNKFQFFFKDETDLIRIERGSPWLFKSFILNLKHWEEDKPVEDSDFIHVSIWIQFWCIPEHYKTKELGLKLGSSFGEVLEADIFQVRGKENIILKAKVKLDITKLLRRSLKISGPNQRILELSIKYERIGIFYNYSGHIGHEVRNNTTQIENSLIGDTHEERWGNWLKSDQGGRRDTLLKENVHPNILLNEGFQHKTPSKPIPVNLIKNLTNLSMQSQNEESGRRREKETIVSLQVTTLPIISFIHPLSNYPSNVARNNYGSLYGIFAAPEG